MFPQDGEEHVLKAEKPPQDLVYTLVSIIFQNVIVYEKEAVFIFFVEKKMFIRCQNALFACVFAWLVKNMKGKYKNK